jgi:hypothetical protein
MIPDYAFGQSANTLTMISDSLTMLSDSLQIL